MAEFNKEAIQEWIAQRKAEFAAKDDPQPKQEWVQEPQVDPASDTNLLRRMIKLESELIQMKTMNRELQAMLLEYREIKGGFMRINDFMHEMSEWREVVQKSLPGKRIKLTSIPPLSDITKIRVDLFDNGERKPGLEGNGHVRFQAVMHVWTCPKHEIDRYKTGNVMNGFTFPLYRLDERATETTLKASEGSRFHELLNGMAEYLDESNGEWIVGVHTTKQNGQTRKPDYAIARADQRMMIYFPDSEVALHEWDTNYQEKLKLGRTKEDAPIGIWYWNRE